jgi:hypothetical protein
MAIENLNPLYTFQTFWVVSFNQFAHAAALAVAEKPGNFYNPLYIYGGDSETRTHLLHAIGHAVGARDRQARIVYISAKHLTYEPNDARRCSQTSNFPELEWGIETDSTKFIGDYWNSDLLLVDDIQLLTENEEAQEKLLDIFDSHYKSDRQMVFSSSAPPFQIPKLSEALKSRFEWGLMADIEESPDTWPIFDSLQRMVEIRRIKVPYDIIYLIAIKLTSSSYYYPGITGIRSLELIVESLAEVISKASSPLNREDLVNEILSKFRKGIPDDTKCVQIVSATAQILEMLRRKYESVHQLSPENFELLICDRLSAMGFNVQRVGSANTPDGGVDIVAWPHKPTPFPFLLAAQVKHHMRPTKKTGPDAVKDLQAVLSAQHHFQAGLLVTSTTFTPNARWFAANHPHIIRLRDMGDLQRWICNNFTDDAEWREIPSTIQLAPGVTIKIPS